MLDAGSGLAFKIWMLSPTLRVLKYMLLAAVIAAVAWLFYVRWDASVIPPAISSGLTFRYVAYTVAGMIGVALLTLVVKALVGKKYGKSVMRVVRWRDTLKYIAIGVGMSTLGFLAARLHLHVFDPLYLRYGKLDKFPK